MGEELSLTALHGALACAVAWVAVRHDRRDRPLAALLIFIVATDLLRMGASWTWHLARAEDLPLLRVAAAWLVDVIFLGWFVAITATAWRYRVGRWPPGLGRWGLALALGLAALMVIHRAQRAAGLPPDAWGVRLSVLYLLCLLAVLRGVWDTVRLLQLGDIAPAHLLLAVDVLLSLLQFVVAITPGVWDMQLYRGAYLVYVTGGLVFYVARIAGGVVRPRAP